VLASSRGLGLGIAEAIAAEGCDVMLTGRSGDRLAEAAEAINQRGAGTARFVVSDLSDKATPAMLADKVKKLSSVAWIFWSTTPAARRPVR
jgi:3-oxoacyl-[acyl-carrier protein] reductase